MHLQLDLVDKVRATAEQRIVRYQDLMAKPYNSRVRHRDFKVRNLILRKVMGATRDPTQGKFSPNWEGPYRITSWQRKDTYHLEMLDRQKFHHPSNIKHLKKYYYQMTTGGATLLISSLFLFVKFCLQYFLSPKGQFFFFFFKSFLRTIFYLYTHLS